MARLRRFTAYRRPKRPWTRISKYKSLSYVKTSPHIHVVAFCMGNPGKKFSYTLHLISKSSLQVRDNAIESARQTSNKLLETQLGLSSYFMQVRKYPHQILREHSMATGAGADRFSSGMARPFGKPVGNAARISKGEPLFSLSVDKNHLELARKALQRAATKLPCSCTIQMIENKA